jgi:predicted acyl esterase
VATRAAEAISFRLDGNGWTFPRGHLIRLELLGRDAPTFAPVRRPFALRLRHLSLTLPVAG